MKNSGNLQDFPIDSLTKRIIHTHIFSCFTVCGHTVRMAFEFVLILEGGSREVPTFLFACNEYICTTMNRRISDSAQQDLYGQPQVAFRPQDFNAAIWSHGYDVICEQAVRCPCQGDSGAPKPDCQNCHGFGYFFINPVRTKALVTGLNRSTNYVQWSPELMGTAAITVRDEDRDLVSYFNRVKIEDEYANFTEMAVTRLMNGEDVAVFLSYAPIEVISAWIYVAPDRPLAKLSSSVYSIPESNPYCLKFMKGNVPEGAGVSVLYRHRVEYHIIDMPHEIRASLGKNKLSGQFEILKMPVQSIGRRTHLIDIQRPNYDGSGLIYNDTK